MIRAALAGMALLSGNFHFRNYDMVKTPATSYFAEIAIKVVPTNANMNAGWIGVIDRHANFVQVGWMRFSGQTRYFQEVWKGGSYTGAWLGTVTSQTVKLGLTTDGRGQWLTWYKSSTGWHVGSVNSTTMALGNTNLQYEVSTESNSPTGLPKLNFQWLAR